MLFLINWYRLKRQWVVPFQAPIDMLRAYQDISIDADCQSFAEGYIEQFKPFRGMVTGWTIEELLSDRRKGLE